MKILQIVTSIAHEADGVAVFVRNLADELNAQGHTCDILTRDSGQGTIKGYDVVHINGLWSPWLHKMAKLARTGGTPVVWSPHGMLTPWALKHKWLKKAVALAFYQYWDLRKAKLVHVTAQSELEDVRRLGLKVPTVVAPLGVRIGPVTRGKGADSARRRNVLFLSRVQKKKGLSMLLEAWAKIKRTDSELISTWRLIIAGPDQDNHVEELKALSARLGLRVETATDPGEISFVGPVYGESKSALYRSSDFFVLPTRSENFGSVVIEALAEECPVVCTKGAPWEELELERCGVWCDISVDGVESALRTMMSKSGSELREMGCNGRKLVEEKYSWASVAKLLTSAYEGAQ